MLNYYLQNTTLHGFSYITSTRHWIERIFWFIAILCSLICCIFLLNTLIVKITKTPIIIDRPDAAVPIKNIPFPAISVCGGSIYEGEREFFDLLFEMNTSSNMYHVENNCKFKFDLKFCDNGGLEWTKFELAVPYWFPLKIEWMKSFEVSPKLTLSQFGWCKTFNIVEYNEMFVKNSTAEYFMLQKLLTSKIDDYKKMPISSKESPLKTIQKDAGYSGNIYRPKNAVMFCDFYKGCNRNAMQKVVVIHSSNELPDMRHRRLDMATYDFLKILIEPQIKITDETLLDLPVDERRCYKEGEKKLIFFKTYTSINCLKECESSFILQKCNCVPYYFINNSSSLICTSSQLKCFKEAFKGFDETKCQCYLPCKDINYEVTSQRIHSIVTLQKEMKDLMMKVVANFKDDSFYPLIRRKYFTMIDWFSFVGGILGLFFGFSFLSAFEVMFHIWTSCFRNNRTSNREVQRISNIKLQKILEYFKKYAQNSSVHGFAYMSNMELKTAQKLSWIISFVLSFTACGFMIRELFYKFTIDSVSIVTSNRYVNLSEIPFPAVTIMNPTIFDFDSEDPDRYKIIDGKKVLDKEYMKLLFILTKIHKRAQKSEFLETDDYGNDISNYSHRIVPIYKTNTVKSYDNIMEIKWDTEYAVPLAHILTTMAFGYSFNIAPDDEVLEKSMVSSDFFYSYTKYYKGGSKNKSQKHPWYSPIRNSEVLDIELHEYTYNPFFYIHSPTELPIQFEKEDINAFELMFYSKKEVFIIPQIITTSEDLRTLPIRQRMCFMEGERSLKFFKIYSQKNCEIECLSERLLEICDCVPFDVIRGIETKVCEYIDYVCVIKVQNELFTNEDIKNSCNCLQPCNHISYTNEFVLTNIEEKLDEDEGQIEYDGGILTFRFKDSEFMSLERIRQFTIFDFMSYIGGLLGLFAGISVLSLFEFFYFFTLRLFCEILRFTCKRRKVENIDLVTVAPLHLE